MRRVDGRSLKGAVAVVFVFDNLAKLTIFLRTIVVSAALGFSKITDAFNLSSAALNAIMSPLSDSLLVGVLPFVAGKKTRQEKIDFVWSAVIVLLAVAGAFLAAIAIFARYFVGMVAPGFETEQVAEAVSFIRILALPLWLGLVTKTIEAFFRAEKVFGYPNAVNLIGAVSGLGMLAVFIASDFRWLAYSSVVSAGVCLVGYALLFRSPMRSFDRSAFGLLKFSLPLVIGASVGAVNSLVDKSFATMLPSGQLTALSYSNQLIMQFGAMFSGPIAGVSYAFIAGSIAGDRPNEAQETITKIGGFAAGFFMLAFGGFWILGEPVLSIVFMRGRMGADEVRAMFDIALVYFPTLFLSISSSLLVNVYYSKKDTILPVVVSIGCMALNIVGNALVVRHLGALGLALTSLVSSIAYWSLNAAAVRKRHGFRSLPVRWTVSILVLTGACVAIVLARLQREPVFKAIVPGLAIAAIFAGGWPNQLIQQFARKRGKA